MVIRCLFFVLLNFLFFSNVHAQYEMKLVPNGTSGKEFILDIICKDGVDCDETVLEGKNFDISRKILISAPKEKVIRLFGKSETLGPKGLYLKAKGKIEKLEFVLSRGYRNVFVSTEIEKDVVELFEPNKVCFYLYASGEEVVLDSPAKFREMNFTEVQINKRHERLNNFQDYFKTKLSCYYVYVQNIAMTVIKPPIYIVKKSKEKVFSDYLKIKANKSSLERRVLWGKHHVSVEVPKKDFKRYDTITVILKITGLGDLERFSPITLYTSADLEEVRREERIVYREGEAVKTISIDYYARSAGIYKEDYFEFDYYDPDKSAVQKQKTELPRLVVLDQSALKNSHELPPEEKINIHLSHLLAKNNLSLKEINYLNWMNRFLYLIIICELFLIYMRSARKKESPLLTIVRSISPERFTSEKLTIILLNFYKSTGGFPKSLKELFDTMTAEEFAGKKSDLSKNIRSRFKKRFIKLLKKL